MHNYSVSLSLKARHCLWKRTVVCNGDGSLVKDWSIAFAVSDGGSFNITVLVCVADYVN